MPSGRSLSMCAHKPDSSLISLVILVVILTRGTIGQDIVFPDENRAEVSQQMRDITATSPSSGDQRRTAVPSEKCGDNMVLDEVNSTPPVCECLRGYLYYRNLDKCYPPYMRGPCDEGQQLVLRDNQTIAECIVNPCGRETMVLYKGTCHDRLSSKGPCPADLALVISETTFKPTCERIQPGNYNFIDAPQKNCTAGSRRAGKHLCRPILSSSLLSSASSSPDNIKWRRE